MSMKKTVLAALLLGVMGVASAADIKGGSSKPNLVEAGSSDPLPFGWKDPGLKFNNEGSWSTSINLEKGPVKYIRIKHGATTHWWTGTETGAPTAINGNNVNANVDGTLNPQHLYFSDVNPVIGWFVKDPLGQVWYENRAYGTEVYSVRQMAEPLIPLAPKFGGLVMAKVPNLPADGHVYFGEWAPRAAGAMVSNSTDLNMNSAQRTVWYVGENPTGNTTGLANASYDVVGVNKHVPGQNDFYTGTVNATFGTAPKGSMSGGITRGNDTLSFAGVNIDNTQGTFSGGAEHIKGRFFGSNAAALAGFAKRGNGVGDDIAFGGHKK